MFKTSSYTKQNLTFLVFDNDLSDVAYCFHCNSMDGYIYICLYILGIHYVVLNFILTEVDLTVVLWFDKTSNWVATYTAD